MSKEVLLVQSKYIVFGFKALLTNLMFLIKRRSAEVHFRIINMNIRFLNLRNYDNF
jgi:hypothetical protein